MTTAQKARLVVISEDALTSLANAEKTVCAVCVVEI